MTKKSKNRKPRVTLKQERTERDAQTYRWNIGWVLENSERYPLRVQSLRLPHDQFKSEEKSFEPPVDVNGGEDLEIQTVVRCDEPVGLVTDNAFAIFYVIWLGEPWRIFARLRVVVNPDGKPEAETQVITAQKVGFSSLTS
jgi:hypothetical protein